MINELLEILGNAVVIEPVHRGLPGLTRFGDRRFHPSPVVLLDCIHIYIIQLGFALQS